MQVGSTNRFARLRRILSTSLLSLAMSAVCLSPLGCDDKKKKDDDGEKDKDDDEEKESLTLTVPDAKLDEHKLETKVAEFTFLNGTKTKDGDVTYAPMARIYLADEKLDKGKPEGDGTLLYINLQGEYAEKESDMIPEGKYKPGIEGLAFQIEVRRDGESKSLREIEGSIKVTKATKKVIEGEIDIDKDGIVIKGPFKAEAK